MPLSEQEQRLLEEMERSLYHNDADFVATVSTRRGRPNYTILVLGVVVSVLGIATLVTGVVLQQPLIGVLGFVVMFVGVLLAVAPPRSRNFGPEDVTEPPKGRAGSSASFMDNLNDRWEKRQDGRE